MSDWSEETIQRAWSVLGVPFGDELESFRLELQFRGQDCRLAQDRHRVRHLLVPCIDEAPAIDARPAVLSTSLRELVFANRNTTYLDVACTDASLHPEFNDVIRDILDEIDGSSAPVTEAGRVISRWRRLFQNRLVRGLSLAAKLGLFAELSVLASLLDVDPGLQVECWRGPLLEPHDFELPRRCIEVKAFGVESDTFTVHGLNQLSSHEGRALDLVLVAVAQDPEGVALFDLVNALQDRVRSRSTLIERVRASGWDSHSAAQEQDRFSVGSVFGIRINDSIPRLVPSSLIAGEAPKGVSNLRYEIDVALVIPHAYESSLPAIAESCLA